MTKESHNKKNDKISNDGESAEYSRSEALTLCKSLAHSFSARKQLAYRH